jgi:hypothetical protein
MALDPNIAMGVRPIEQPNMLAQYGQVMAIKQAQQEMEGNAGVNELARRGEKDPYSYLQYGKQGQAAAASITKIQKEKLDSDDKRNVMLGGLAGPVIENPTPQTFNFALDRAVNYGLMTPTQKQEVLAQYGGSPDAIKGYAAQIFKGSITAQAQQSNQTQIRGQDLTHGAAMANVGLARERLTADMTPLAIDDATVDLVANRYLIDGTLPPLGMGKPAAMLRAKILDRAQNIATQSPAATPSPNTTPSVSVSPQTEIPAPGAAPVVNNLNPAPTAATPAVNNLVAPPVAAPAPVGITPQQAAQNIVTSKVNTATQKRALTDFSTGIQGRMVNSMNTAVEHLSTLTELADALKNNDVRAINTVGNLVAKQTGSPAPTNFAAARQIVAQEIVKAIVANGGTGREREEAAANIAAAGSPEQLAGVISTYQELLAGQLKSLGLQYKNTTGRDDFNTKLLPSTIRALDRTAAKTPAKTGDITSDAGIAKVIKSNAEYDALPSGTTFTAPDGSTRRKP